MRKNKDLKWFAFREDFNSNTLVYINVLGKSFADELLKRIKKYKIVDYNSLKENIAGMLRYNYWGKAEHEVVVHSLIHRPDKDKEFKIDVWYQLEPNLDRIVEYIMKDLQIEF